MAESPTRAAANPPQARALTRGGLLARNVGWNLLGVLLPLAVAVFAIPVLIRDLGEARFGLLSLAWVFIGYFNIFDLGFGRALTKVVSTRIAERRQASIPALVATALNSVLLLAASTATVVWLAAPWLVDHVMTIPAALQAEARGVLRVLALAIPFVIVGTVLRGVLEAFQRFDLVNLVRLSSGLYLFLGPLAMLPFTQDMVWLIGMLAAGKLVGTLTLLRLSLRLVPDLTSRWSWSAPEFRALFVFGGWITAGNTLGPLLTYTDHFLIGALVSVAMVGFYIVPYQMVTKLWVVVTAIVGVLFPALSIHLVDDPARARRVFLTAMKAVVVVVGPAAFLLTAFAGEILALWLGAQYRDIAAPLLQLFAIGVFINSFSIVTLALVQAAGRPDWVPKLFAVEMPVYLPGLYLAIQHGGLIGAALVWLAKIVVDFSFLIWATQRLLPPARPSLIAAAPGFALLLASFAPLLTPLPLGVRAPYATLWIAAFAWLAWRRLLDDTQRSVLAKRIRSPWRRSVGP
ncbi:flippase [Sinimarinibacterium thermocellulolyticum]|uniref:Flippase n=1 Tax=Sinimarinibacterium thermocellulolyticum TaxID=3170016 RepID=A0ABV2AAW6_9GAMM